MFKLQSDELIEGPIFVKTGSDPGRYCQSEQSIKFCPDMSREGVLLGPGLPNTTNATQDMDDWFQEFKGHMDMMAQEIFEQLCYDHAKAVCHHQADR